MMFDTHQGAWRKIGLGCVKIMMLHGLLHGIVPCAEKSSLRGDQVIHPALYFFFHSCMGNVTRWYFAPTLFHTGNLIWALHYLMFLLYFVLPVTYLKLGIYMWVDCLGLFPWRSSICFWTNPSNVFFNSPKRTDWFVSSFWLQLRC